MASWGTGMFTPLVVAFLTLFVWRLGNTPRPWHKIRQAQPATPSPRRALLATRKKKNLTIFAKCWLAEDDQRTDARVPARLRFQHPSASRRERVLQTLHVFFFIFFSSFLLIYCDMSPSFPHFTFSSAPCKSPSQFTGSVVRNPVLPAEFNYRVPTQPRNDLVTKCT